MNKGVLKKESNNIYDNNLYVIAHDLSASFNHIKGFAEILSGKIADKITAEDQLYFEHLILAVRKSEAMLSAITKLSHIPL
ncbi:MAG: hypothetical protein AAF621_06350, partial [Pseudomonadota bacterium]